MERPYAKARYTYEIQNVVLVFLYIPAITSHRRCRYTILQLDNA